MDYFSNYQDTTFLVTTLATHLLMAIALWRMAKKKNDPQPWLAWIPILSGFLLLRLAKRPLWWMILFFIPIVNFAIAIVVFMDLCEQFGVNKWWGLLALISPANLILLYVLAFMDYDSAPVKVAASSVMPDVAPPAPPKVTSDSLLNAETPKPEDPDLSTPDLPMKE